MITAAVAGLFEAEGGEEIVPGGKDQKDGDRPQMVEESDARAGLVAGPCPQVLGQLRDGMVGEGDQIEVTSTAARLSLP